MTGGSLNGHPFGGAAERVGAPRAAMCQENPLVCRVSSFSFTGLLSCDAVLQLHMSRKALVEMSPVRMIAGIWRSSTSRSLAVTCDPVHAVRQIVVRQNEVWHDLASRHQFQRRRRRRLRWSRDGPSPFRNACSRSRTSGSSSTTSIVTCSLDGGDVPRHPRHSGGGRGCACRFAWWQHDIDGEDRTLARTCERTPTRWPSSFPRRCTIERPRPRPRPRSRAGLSS